MPALLVESLKLTCSPALKNLQEQGFNSSPLFWTMQGCGLVCMVEHSNAVAAMQALNGKHIWGDKYPAFVVKWSSKPEDTTEVGECFPHHDTFHPEFMHSTSATSVRFCLVTAVCSHAIIDCRCHGRGFCGSPGL